MGLLVSRAHEVFDEAGDMPDAAMRTQLSNFLQGFASFIGTSRNRIDVGDGRRPGDGDLEGAPHPRVGQHPPAAVDRHIPGSRQPVVPQLHLAPAMRVHVAPVQGEARSDVPIRIELPEQHAVARRTSVRRSAAQRRRHAEIALRGDYLLVLTETQTLEIYNARTGAYLRTWPVQAQAPAELDAYAGVAIYVAYPRNTLQSFKIHALQLKTGKDVVVATGNFQLRRSAELEPAGLLYARDRHNLVLIPFKRVLAAVS